MRVEPENVNESHVRLGGLVVRSEERPEAEREKWNGAWRHVVGKASMR